LFCVASEGSFPLEYVLKSSLLDQLYTWILFIPSVVDGHPDLMPIGPSIKK